GGGRPRQLRAHRLDRDLGRRLDRVAICPRADRRERDRLDAVLVRELETVDVAAAQQLGLVPLPAAPHGAYRVDHVLGRQPVSPRNPRFTGRAPAEPAALIEQLGPTGALTRVL